MAKVSQEQMDDFLAAILASNLSNENAEFAKMLIHVQGSEKAPNRKPKNDPASTGNKGSSKGHGRNSADAYQGAAIVEVEHPTCPDEECDGRLLMAN